MPRRAITLLGVSIAFAGVVGFLTFADDFRHAGEIAIASGLVVIGLILAVTPALPSRYDSLLVWIPSATLLGMLVGILADRTLFGVIAGIFSGLFIAWWHSRTHRPDA